MVVEEEKILFTKKEWPSSHSYHTSHCCPPPTPRQPHAHFDQPASPIAHHRFHSCTCDKNNIIWSKQPSNKYLCSRLALPTMSLCIHENTLNLNNMRRVQFSAVFLSAFTFLAFQKGKMVSFYFPSFFKKENGQFLLSKLFQHRKLQRPMSKLSFF